MKLIRPITTACGDLISTNVPQPYDVWDAEVTYAKGAIVVDNPCGARVFESVVNSNLGNDPDDGDLTKWLPIGVSNAFAMFDNSNSTATTNPDEIIVEVDVSNLTNAVALINCQASSARFEIFEAGQKIFDETVFLRDFGSVDWYDFYFGEIQLYPNYVNYELPSITDAVGKLTLSRPGNTASIGSLVYGTSFDVGETLYGITFGIRDFSIKDTDEFGNAILVKRGFRNTIEASLKIDNVAVSRVLSVLAEYRATPAVWVADQDRDYTILFGYYNDFSIVLPHPAYAECSLTLEALT